MIIFPTPNEIFRKGEEHGRSADIWTLHRDSTGQDERRAAERLRVLDTPAASSGGSVKDEHLTVLNPNLLRDTVGSRNLSQRSLSHLLHLNRYADAPRL